MEQKLERHHEVETGLISLLMRLPDQLSQLMRSEMTLAKMEIRAKATEAGKDAILLAAGVFLAFLGVLAAVATAIIAVSIALPLWLSALIFTLALLIGGGALALLGMSRLKRINWTPNKTVETVKENIQWLRQQKR